jgi:hypothetical protein
LFGSIQTAKINRFLLVLIQVTTQLHGTFKRISETMLIFIKDIHVVLNMFDGILKEILGAGETVQGY